MSETPVIDAILTPGNRGELPSQELREFLAQRDPAVERVCDRAVVIFRGVVEEGHPINETTFQDLLVQVLALEGFLPLTDEQARVILGHDE